MSFGERGEIGAILQLQQRQVGIAVICLVGALLCDIFLEDGRRLGVVSVQSIEDLVNIFRPLRRVIECDAHGDVCVEEEEGWWWW